MKYSPPADPTRIALDEWLRGQLRLPQAQAVLNYCNDNLELNDILIYTPEELIGVGKLTAQEVYTLAAAFALHITTTRHPAVVGHKLTICQNGGLRDATVVRVTKTRVRIEWPRISRRWGKTAGRWFRHHNGFIVDRSGDILAPKGKTK